MGRDRERRAMNDSTDMRANPDELRRAAERERAAMLEGAKQDIADMVVSAAGKLAGREIDPAADRALYDRFLEEAQAAQEDRP